MEGTSSTIQDSEERLPAKHHPPAVSQSVVEDCHKHIHLSNKMPALPVEIWNIVARHARQSLPFPDQEGVTWKELHQQDLTTLMRVSKVGLSTVENRPWY